MGNVDSKVGGEQEDSVVNTLASKEGSHFSHMSNSNTDISSYDAGDEGGDAFAHMDEKKEHNPASSRRNTPTRGNKKTRRGNVQSRDDDTFEAATPSTHIKDDQVHVNLAMADLMAYLQVVANNSNMLPLTRRDDPELGKTVSSLTLEEFASKSAAFIPSDVRFIGATFTRYGRVLDLPTSQEYNAVDGALEPGRSYGGACCNALLKVVYDAANDAADAAQTQEASEALFDDDDDMDDESAMMGGKSVKSGYSLEYATPDPSSITWADLLRKMKAEMKEIQYAQAPKITTTRKIDLNKPFSLVPETFDPINGKKRSLLIGCNYNNIHGAELKASHDDVRSMKDYIVNVHGFPETPGLMTVLMDDDNHRHPTFLNITEAFKALSEESQTGDAVFVQFSGHGGRTLDDYGDAKTQSYDEVIVPSDANVSGLIRDTLIFKTLLAPMRYGVTVTIMSDCCDNGMMLEMPYSWTTMNEKKDSIAKLSMNEDFSFVRFLKVVKTMYESSAFTQLGKTVGSALNPSVPTVPKRSKAKKPDTEEMKREKIVSTSAANSIFDVIDEACATSKKNSPAKSKGVVKRQDLPTQSLLDQVMNCTRAHGENDETDDEDTFRTQTYEESFDTEGLSFESMASMTDDDCSRRHK